MLKRIVVAIDGPAGAGKSTVARAVAQRLGYLYIDTGAMYRAVAYAALRSSIGLDDPNKLTVLAHNVEITLQRDGGVLLNGEDVTLEIRMPDVATAASRVSTVAGVRDALVAQQRRLAENQSVVMEGRDIGSVVFPDAQVKVYLDAEPEVRAARRVLDLEAKGVAAAPQQLAQEMRERDARDRSRLAAPLLQAPDAELIDSSSLSQQQVEERILALVRARTTH